MNQFLKKGFFLFTLVSCVNVFAQNDILGEKEDKNNNLSVRKRKEGDLGQMSTNEFVSLINGELSKSIAKFE